MKRYLTTILLALCCTIGAMAQDHMKFMGIPIDGTIKQFTKKLSKKGIKVDKDNKHNKNNTIRWFVGKFGGKECSFFVYFSPKDKTVYRVKVLYETTYKSDADEQVGKWRASIDSKYTGQTSDKMTTNNEPCKVFYLKDGSGSITTLVTESSEHTFYGQIWYTDKQNLKKDCNEEGTDI